MFIVKKLLYIQTSTVTPVGRMPFYNLEQVLKNINEIEK